MSRLVKWLNEIFLNILNENTILFKIIISLFVINFVAFLGLARINPLELVNPTLFMDNKASDSRKNLKLYFPKSLLNEKDEKELPIEKIIIPIEQKVIQGNACDNYFALPKIVCDAKMILHELALGPTQNQVLVKRLFKERKLIEAVNFYKGYLVLNLNKVIWDNFTKRDQKVIKYSFEKSLLTNLRSVTKVITNIK